MAWNPKKETKKKIFFVLISLLLVIGTVMTDYFWLEFVSFLRLTPLNPIMIFLGGMGGIVILILLTFLATKRVFFILSFLTTGALSYALKYFIQRPRPFLVTTITPLLIKHSPSFPSTHAALAGACIPFLKGKWRRWLLIPILLVASTGFYNGVHYVSDIIGGLLLGWGIGLILLSKKEVILALIEKIKKKIKQGE